MGSGSAWCVRKEVDGDMSCVGRAGAVDGWGERGREGKRRCGEESGCWMYVWGMVCDDGGEYGIRECPTWAERARRRSGLVRMCPMSALRLSRRRESIASAHCTGSCAYLLRSFNHPPYSARTITDKCMDRQIGTGCGGGK